MVSSQNIQSTQDTATTSFTSTSDVFEPGELKKYRKYWWKTSKVRWDEATLPYELATDFTEFDMKKLNQEFSNCIGWINTPAEKIILQYFDNNCQGINDKNYKRHKTLVKHLTLKLMVTVNYTEKNLKS
ncbi:unnamed protein product [Rhizophagus irregularis]|nr:unnamed protein product [Rhizophagus irregularis]